MLNKSNRVGNYYKFRLSRKIQGSEMTLAEEEEQAGPELQTAVARLEIDTENREILLLTVDLGFLFAAFRELDPEKFANRVRSLRRLLRLQVIRNCKFRGVDAEVGDFYHLELLIFIFDKISVVTDVRNASRYIANYETPKTFAINGILSRFQLLFETIHDRSISVREVHIAKRGVKGAIFDPQREEAILKRIESWIDVDPGATPQMKEAVVLIFQKIIEQSRLIQEFATDDQEFERVWLEGSLLPQT